MKTIPLFLCGALCVSIASPCAFAADYQGADAVMKQAAEQAGLLASTAANTGGAPTLKRDLKAFHEVAATLEPHDAGRKWLQLAERFGRLPPGAHADVFENGGLSDPEPLSIGTIVAALPPPPAWDALAEAAEATATVKDDDAFRTTLLRLIAHWLTGNRAGQENDVAALDALLAKVQGPMRGPANRIELAIKSALLQTSDDGEAILKNLNDTLDRYAGADPSQNAASGVREFPVPDLVSLVGEKKAADLLRRALGTDGLQLSVTDGEETGRLARKVALEMIGDLKMPQWELARSLDATDLYEAMTKRFPETDEKSEGRDRDTARTYYLLGLIAAHRTKDATFVALEIVGNDEVSLPRDALAALERAGFTSNVVDFLHDFLEQNPDLPFWEQYVQLAVRSGGTDKMVALAEAFAAREGLPEAQHREIQKTLRHAYFAADKVEKGVALLTAEIASSMTGQPNAGERNSDLTDSGMELARIGAALKREDLITQGIQAVRYSLGPSGKLSPDVRQRALNSLAGFLIENGRGVEAETALAESLSSIKPGRSGMLPAPVPASRVALILLMDVYHRANRPADVLALLDGSPRWGVKDLAEVYTEMVLTDHNTDYAGYFAAAALAASDRKAEARKINDALLDRESGYDPSFELMLKLEPDEAVARLDALFARDKFEPRPLIWKAKLLFDQGKLEEAEAAARQAITIDPSDGQQGRGRRMRVYSVLADIREARGDAKEAESLRGAVTAIRHSEEADRFYEAGLITRAVTMYQEALTHFSDAYCIQSRLALRMTELGDMEGAEEHYRRAYELMPDSFGRVESHCFGCERAFEGNQPQSIAEKVFTELAATRPEKPQVHYLLGYLRFEQDRYRDALPEFREAVRLDPDYLNAWKKLAQVGGKMRLPVAERDAIQLNMLRLDPLGRHSNFDARNVTDLRAAWTALETAAKAQTPDSKELYPLASSALALAEAQENLSPSELREADNYAMRYRRTRRRAVSPGQMVAQHQLVQSVSALFNESRQLFHDE